MRLYVFTYAPAGLGHLRVTDALVDTRPKGLPYLLLGSYDKFLTDIHRLTSINPIARYIFQTSQYGLVEDIFTKLYRFALVKSPGKIKSKLEEIILSHREYKEIFVIATHFGMAHQIGAVKEELSKKYEVDIKLVVQVTDDTSQHIWCVKGADLTFLPSTYTKEQFEIYAKQMSIPFFGEVCPYPLSPVLTSALSSVLGKRSDAFSHNSDDPINVAVPISGAATGLVYATDLMMRLRKESGRYEFWIVVKKSPYTQLFLSRFSSMPGFHLIIGGNDNEMVSLYELLYEEHLIHMEITKPSEQAFKALLGPKMCGGSILLLSNPVGRQEFDNVEFLTRNGLLSSARVKDAVPRGIRLPSDTVVAAQLIEWARKSGLFLRMSDDKFQFPTGVPANEINSAGASMFWKILEEKFK